MKVGILGAPGAGKSKLAKKLVPTMEAAGFKRPVVIDGYVEKLEKKTDTAFGRSASPARNMQLLFYRWTLELEAAGKGEDTITCGTAYESFIYSVLHSNLLWEINPTDVVSRSEAQATLSALGMLEKYVYNYHVLLYLPYTDKKIGEKGHHSDIVVNDKIPEVLTGFYKVFAVLDRTQEENVTYATEIIEGAQWELEEVEREEATEDEQRAIRGSGESSEEEPDQEPRVPDVRS